MSRKLTKNEFLDRLPQHNYTFLGEYIDTHTNILTECSVCGHQWFANPQHLMRGHGCPQCAYNKRKGTPVKRKSHDEFIKELHAVNNNIIVKNRYINAKSYLHCECKVCGHIWDAKASNLLSGFGCPDCAVHQISQKQLKPNDTFINELAIINPKVILLETYKGNKTPIEVMCKDCGHRWHAMPINLLRKDGKATACPRCRRSHGEAEVAKWLDEHSIEYIPQYRFDDLVGAGGRQLSYDFYIPQYNSLIEYQGEYHDHTVSFQSDDDFETQRLHDLRKKEYAETHDYSLILIWYYDNVREVLSNQLV